MNETTNNSTVIDEGVDTSTTNSTNQNEQQTFTRDEVLALIQSESDKRVTAALKTAQKKFDKQLSLSKLDDSEREKAEKDNLIAELQEQLAQMNTERNRSDLKSVLSSRGLSAEFADIIVINDDIETSQANIDKLDKLFKAAVKAEVEKRLAGTAPKGNATYQAAGDVTPEQFKKMSLTEQGALYAQNPELYKRLTQK
ncbi:MAG: DUF4355 domain-containing protein [Paludibacteraceae bacterium]|nr:DUF4355 domain-containing protein [Paludibacteraceae bacterium]